MKQKLLLKSLVLLFALIAGSTSAWADYYTITFKSDSGNGSSISTSTACSTIVSDGSSYLSGNVVIATNASYNGEFGLKLGVSGSAGVLKMNLANAVKPTSIVVNAKLYNSGKAATIAVNGKTAQSLAADFDNYTFSFDGDTEITYIQLNSSKYCWVSSVTVNYTAAGTTAAPTISGNTPFFGTTTATITNAASAGGADIYYTLNGENPTTTTSATCFAYSAAFSLDATTTVKAIAKKSTDTNASSVVSKTFTKVAPTTVAAALTAIDALADNETIEEQSVRGIVTEVSSYSSNTITYTISDDVTGSNSLKVYKGKGLHNANFAAKSDVKVGDDVVIYGTLKKYKSGSTITPQFNEGNYLLYQEHKTAPTFTLDRSNATLSMGTDETVDVTLTTNTDGEISCESSNNNAATVALKSAGVYTITAVAEGTATIKIKSALTNNYQPAEATVTVTVNDTREAPGLAFANATVTKTWGESFTGQALTNPHSLPVTWSSSEEAVATVNSTGVVTILKAGTTTIKATFDGDATYKKAIVSYTLTINKAAAGLSYTTTEFDIMLNDDSFVAPTLNNPNGLTVTYASNNTDVAVVDENTGELLYESDAAGTAKITASFAGNDNYYPGSANYTINIIDPSVKGTKYNPYTVADVEGQSSATAFGNNIYVTGYIVGCVDGSTSKCYKTTTGSLVNTNFLLADTPDLSFTEGAAVSSVSGVAPVELPSGTIRTNWGVASNNVFGYKVVVKGNAQSYFSKKGIKSTSEVTAVSVPVTPAYARTTYVTTKALDFSDVDGLKAYAATAAAAGVITFDEVGAVPAPTPLMLIGTAGTTYNVPVVASASAPATNLLKAGDGATEFDGSTFDYILFSDGLFYQITSGTVATTKAYLHCDVDPTAGSGARGLDVVFGDETAINALENATKINDGAIYDLSGRRVENPTKGIYIINGKKVVVR